MSQHICPVCQAEVARRGKRGPLPTYCSAACRAKASQVRRKVAGGQRRRPPRVAWMQTCDYCSEQYEADRKRMYCSKACSNAASRARITKTCRIEGCVGKMAARGLCSTHYNRTHLTKDQRHKRVATPCVVCGIEAVRRQDDRYRHVCSTACRSIVTWGTEVRAGECNRAAVLLSRAQRYGVVIIDVFDPVEIFERDGWTCYLCGELCEGYGDTCNPRAATVDHVTSLSNGGEHSRANARTACLGCNSSKSNRDTVAA